MRRRQAEDIDACVAVLRRVHDSDDYPHNWPADASAWLAPADMAEAWVAEMGHAVVGHVLVRHRDAAANSNAAHDAPANDGNSAAIRKLAITRLWPRHTAEHDPKSMINAEGDAEGDAEGGAEGGAEGVGEVARLFVAPEARGRGLGEALLAQTKRWAAEHGKRLVLEVSTSRGEGAIALYERTGWRSTGSEVADWCTPEGRPVVLRRYEFTAAGVS